METTLFIFSGLLILLSVLPFVKNQHWIFRIPEFMKIQILILQLAVLLISFFFQEKTTVFWIVNGVQILLVFYHLYILSRYTQFYKKNKKAEHGRNSEKISVISANVYQFNTDFKRFQKLIEKYKPDIFITIESNREWEKANQILEKEYPNTEKVTLENTYGMHLYSKIPFKKTLTHFFVADDVPSIEAHFRTKDGFDFVLFSVHPPPPSPTEETTSKERDGDLLSIAKAAKKMKKPTVVIGDFNTVAWSDTSILFRKSSELIDGRVGRGILASFHAKYWFVRIPLDLLFHSADIFISKLQSLEYFGSDHFPILCEFHINREASSQEDEIKTLRREDHEEVEELIEEGKKEVSENREEVATE